MILNTLTRLPLATFCTPLRGALIGLKPGVNESSLLPQAGRLLIEL